jgi:autotransporter-associated beta strand protein
LAIKTPAKIGISFSGRSDFSEKFGNCGCGRYGAPVTRTLVLPLLAASLAAAGDLSWDATSGDGAVITHGVGAWNLSNAFWNDGSGNVAWSNTTPRNNAIFVGNASGVTTVTIGSDPLQVGNITINGAGGTMVLNGNYANLNAESLAVKTSAAGKLAINNSGTLANVATISVANGATVYIANATVNSAVALSGQGNTENLGAIRVDNGTLQGSIHLQEDSTFGSNSGSGIIAAAVTGNFAFHRSSAGNGTIRFTGNNSHSGGTTVSRAVVQAGHNRAFGTGTLTLSGGTLSSDSTTARTFANAVTLGPGITLGHATQSGKLTFSGTATAITTATLTAASAVEFAEIRAASGIQRAGSGTFTLGRFTALASAASLAGETITLPAAGAVIDTAGFDVLVTAKLSGGPLVKTGAGTLTLDQTPPNFTGNTTVAQGTLHLKGQSALPSNLKIMPLGDSITVGGSTSGYRSPLYQHLLSMAPGFQFIGDSTSSPGSLPAGSQNHSGHSSYSTDDIRKNLDGLDFTTFNTYGSDSRDPRGGYWFTGLASAVTYTVPNRGTFTYGPRAPLHPDAILLLVGSNDIYRAGSTNGDHRANYTALLNEIYRLRPTVHVFAGKITPHGTNDALALAFNSIVEQVVAGFQAAGKPITLVDLHTGYTGGLPDNLHPDSTGYAWIAGKWRDALAATLSSESALSLRTSPLVQVAAGATLSGNAIVNQLAVEGSLAPGAAEIGTITASSAILPGTFQCQIIGASCDRLVVDGNLNFTGGTLALSANVPAGRAHVIATYGGMLTGNFATITGLPDGFEVYHDAPRKRLIVGRPYNVWRAFHNLPDAASGAIPDADNDGENDLIEFIAGSNPTDPASRPSSSTRSQDGPDGTRLLLATFSLPAGTFFVPAGDGSLTTNSQGITLRVQGSRDLIHWNQPVAPASPVGGLPFPPAGREYQSFSLPADAAAAKGFIRLTASP